MPDNGNLHPRRTLEPEGFAPNPRAPFVELGLASCFSFLRGASDALDLAATASALGYDAIGIADHNTLAGVVRLHVEAKKARLRPVIGCRLELVTGEVFLAYPVDRAAYGRLSRLLSRGKMQDIDGAWQAKGRCDLTLDDLAAHAEGLQLILVPDAPAPGTGPDAHGPPAAGPPAAGPYAARPYAAGGPEGGAPRRAGEHPAGVAQDAPGQGIPGQGTLGQGTPGPADPEAVARALPRLCSRLPGLRHIAVRHLYRGDDRARINALDRIATAHGLSILATNDVLYHAPDRRPLQDVMTCIREKCTLAEAGFRLVPNAERHLKSPAEMARLFAEWPHAIAATRAVADACRFDLEELKYEYPREVVPEGHDPQSHLEALTWQGAAERYPDGVDAATAALLRKELAMIAKLDIARYFLTIHDIIRFARHEAQPPILCQGRGSAANSAVCYVLGITAVDPTQHQLLFERFISEERKEPPDIDVDFEHERREEVIQHIYAKYGRDRAGLCATVIHYRPRSAIREVGKVMGLSEDVTGALARTVWGSWGKEIGEAHVREAGLDLSDPVLRRTLLIAQQLIGMPRHLGQHVGGFILTERPLTETVPIGNGAMPERSFIEWDKDDIDALGILKVDILALGMLTCIRKCLDLVAAHHGQRYDLAGIPQEDPRVYEMLCRGDSIGVFQVESRAQMNMLPRLRPRTFYDLVIQVAIVRPGPIQGDMVHPYLRRRSGEEAVDYPSPGAPHDPAELKTILGRTLGVPIFQEQAMKIAIEAAQFSPAEANELRKAMATFRSAGTIGLLEEKMVGRMVARGYDADFARRCFDQIKGFGEYGFPESHAASFALLVYVSSWLKCHFPGEFAAALLNSQPMGFYAPAQIVRDAAAHGVELRGPDANFSDWDCTMEPAGALPSLPLPSLPSPSLPSPSLPSPGPTSQSPAARNLPPQGTKRRGLSHQDPSPAAPPRPHPVAGHAPHAAGPHDPAPHPAPHLAPHLAPPSGPGFAPRFAPRFALRLGLRQIGGLPREAAARIVAARDTPYRDLAEIGARARVGAAVLRKLAEADALRSLFIDRRQALWEAKALRDAPDLPLFRDAPAEGAETPVPLPAMPVCEQVVADYQTLRLSLKAHPMAFLRRSLARQGYVSAADLARMPHFRKLRMAGLVLIRQRPGSAKGVCFITIEDETGVANLVVWPKVMESFRKAVMQSRLIVVEGHVQRDVEIVHVVAERLEDRSDALLRLAPEGLTPQLSRADEIARATPPGSHHPRDLRVIPKSRDFQ